jgi:hypothetical protein
VFWLTYDTPLGIEAFIARARFLMIAKPKACMAVPSGQLQESHRLLAKTVQNTPSNLVGRTLTCKETLALLKRNHPRLVGHRWRTGPSPAVA